MAAKNRASGTEHFEWFDAFREPVLLVSGDGAVLAANASFLRLVGAKKAAGSRLSEFTFGPPEIAGQYLQACSAGGEPMEGSLLLTDAEGELASCRCEATVVEPHAQVANRRILLRLFPANKASDEVSSQQAGRPPDDSDDAQPSPAVDSERRLQLAINSVELAIWEWNAKTDEMVATAGLQSMRGQRQEPYRGSLGDYINAVFSEDRGRVAKAIQEALENGKKYRVEYRVILRNLVTRWFEDRGSPVCDEKGATTGIVCLTVPIDQRKQLEQQFQSRLDRLSQTEAQVRSVIETAVDGIITINERGVILNVNPAAERIFGYTSAEIVGKNVSMLMPEPYSRQHNRYLANYLRTGHGKIIGTERELVGRRRDGAVFPMDLGVSEAQLEGRRYFTGIVRDISERKRTENVAHFLADASRSLATLVDYASTLQQVAYLAVPFFADWCTVHISHEDGSLRQLAAAHIDPDKAVVAQELGNGYPVALGSSTGPAHVFKTGRAELVEVVADSLIEGLAEDAQHRKVLQSLGLLSYMGVPLMVRGKVLGVMSFFSADPRRKYDLTDLGMAEDLAHRASIAIENSLLYAELRESDRRKDEFLATLAEQLRGPLGVIQCGVGADSGDPKTAETARAARTQVDRLARLTDDLLTVSRIMQGRVDLKRQAVPVGALVQQAVDQVRPWIAAAEQDLTVHVPPEPIQLCADPERIVQAVAHLLRNANKYTGSGGQIALSVRQQRDQVFISVEDNGAGISEQSLPHLFDLFSYSERRGGHIQGGLGIGLTLVRSLVEMHDGAVTVSSEGEGKGSEFIIRLPIHKAAIVDRDDTPRAAIVDRDAALADQQPSLPAEQLPTAQGRRILVVEDNVGTAMVLSRLLAKLGDHQIRVVHDGLAAIDAAKEHRPEIVLLDIGLPRMNGYEVAKNLRAQAEFRDVVLVALTGYGTEEDRRRSAAAGFDRHIVKPPSLEHLRQVLAHPRLTK